MWAALPANRIVDVTPVWPQKQAALDQHRCGRVSFDLDAHLALTRWRSIFVMNGWGYAEAFLALPRRRFLRPDRGARGVKIVHLAFEDHRRPGSGGGGLRTFEVNRRLAEFHHITVVTARYPGARRRVEEGVVYRPLGCNLGYFGSVVTYFLLLPFFVAVQRADLIVEDFAAPMSSALVPLFTRTPTVAVVQWLFARERSRHYHLPLFIFEKLGVRLHRRFVAVSAYIAEQLRAANQRARIDVVPAGVAVPVDMGPPGRGQRPGPLSRPAGVGAQGLRPAPGVPFASWPPCPASGWCSPATGRTGSGSATPPVTPASTTASTCSGWVTGDAKWRLLASATVVVVPSRHESFGLVAAEASSIGNAGGGLRPAVPTRDPRGRGRVCWCPASTRPPWPRRLRRVLTDPALRAMLAEQGRRQAGRFDWDRAALAHDRVYRAAVLEGR